MFDYKVIDDFFSREAYLSLKLRLDRDVDWKHNVCITGHESIRDKTHLYSGGMGRVIKRDDHEPNKVDLYPEFTNLFGFKLSETFDVEHILRIRCGLQLPINVDYVHDPHVDYTYPHWTALLYFCTEKGAGETYLYNQKYDDSWPNPYIQWQKTKDEFEVIEKVEPKENRCLIFRGDIFHSSSTPRSIARRLAVNVNFQGNPKHGTETNKP